MLSRGLVFLLHVGTAVALWDIHDSKYCQEGHCLNGGNCVKVNYTRCYCPPGFSGAVCGHVDDRHCATNTPCVHGTCTSLSHSPYYRCHCNNGWIGYACHIPDASKVHASHCDAAYSRITCHHHGYCANITTHPYFRCYCSQGYEGYRCELQENHCKPNPCINGGVCHQTTLSGGVTWYKCTCPKGFSGKNCHNY